MSSSKEAFLKELKAAFRAEAREQIQRLTLGLLELEGGGLNLDAAKKNEIVESIFREAHNLKGSARATDYKSIEAVCQELESILSLVKHKQLAVTQTVLEPALTAMDALAAALAGDCDEIDQVHCKLLAEITNLLRASYTSPSQEPEFPALPPEPQQPVPGRLADASQSESPSQTLAPEVVGPADRSTGEPGVEPVAAATKTATAEKAFQVSDSIRVSGSALDHLLLQAEEMLSFKVLVKQHANDVARLTAMLDSLNTEWSQIFPYMKMAQLMVDGSSVPTDSTQVVSVLSRLIDFANSNHQRFVAVQEKLNAVSRSLTNDDRYTCTAVDTLLIDTKQLLMLPCSTIFDIFPKHVRDLSRELGKEVDFSVDGADIKLDKRILAKIMNPLMHLVRNSMDHGIEKPEVRISSGKPRRASIKITIKQLEAGLNEIVISDDGAGINLTRVKEMSIKGNFISREAAEKLSKSEIVSLIFNSSLSTSRMITEISGRGLGMAIVKDNITQLGGRLEVHTDEGVGTRFVLLLPTTIASFRGIIIRCGGHLFVLPTISVEQVIRVPSRDLKRIENCDTISFGNTIIPVVRLADVLNLSDADSSKRQVGARFILATVLNASGIRTAFTIDEIVQEQEVLVKPFKKPLLHVRNLSGATVLGSGEVIPVLNVTDLVKSAQRHADLISRQPSQEFVDADAEAKKKILVVDDTITTRMLLKNILQAAGYHVIAANDGLEAYTFLKEEAFDLVVTDVEMPNMNGFELTRQIRRDPLLAHIPVVLVTSLASSEEREKGGESGADAYFVKSKFDQNNLLEVIERLVLGE